MVTASDIQKTLRNLQKTGGDREIKALLMHGDDLVALTRLLPPDSIHIHGQGIRMYGIDILENPNIPPGSIYQVMKNGTMFDACNYSSIMPKSRTTFVPAVNEVFKIGERGPLHTVLSPAASCLKPIVVENDRKEEKKEEKKKHSTTRKIELD